MTRAERNAAAGATAAIRRLRAPLLRWYRRHRRDLPWRRTRDPYSIWVSEVMLQQTTVAAVVPYWERFVERFPDLRALADSREDEVLASWTGLGYYRRARSLRAGAIAVMERHDGRVPDDPEALLELPGVGRYTAGAIASLAFGREAPVVDGNVKRVFSRLFGLRDPRGAASERRFWSIASTLVRGGSPGDLNQALMELGATVCVPRAPRCPACPVARHCRARELGTPEAFPVPKPSAKAREVRVAVGWIERNGAILLERQHEGGPLRGAWDLPATTIPEARSAGRALVDALSSRHGIAIRPGETLTRGRHAILATRLVFEVVDASLRGALGGRPALRWVGRDELGAVATSGATMKIVRAVTSRGTA